MAGGHPERAPSEERLTAPLRHARDRSLAVLHVRDVRFIALLALLHLAITAALATAAGWLPFDRLVTSDVPLFDERAAAILDGDWTSRSASVPPDTPPLVNYLFLVPHLMGGGLAGYALFFSGMVFAAALAFFLGLRTTDPTGARRTALLVTTHPLSWGTALLIVQDEALVAALVAFAVVAMLRRAWAHAGVWTGLGTLVKAFPLLAAPVVFLGLRDRRARTRLVAGGALAVLAPLMLFLLLDPAHLMHVATFYGGGVRPDRTTPSGISFWKFLDVTTGSVAEPLLVGLFLAASMTLWVLVARRRLSIDVGVPLAFVAFFLFYPKLHFGYYLILLMVLAPWMARTPWAGVCSLLIAGLAAAAHMTWYGFMPGLAAGRPLVPLLLTGMVLVLVVALGIGLSRTGGPLLEPPRPVGGPTASVVPGLPRPLRGIGTPMLGTLAAGATVGTLWAWGLVLA